MWCYSLKTIKYNFHVLDILCVKQLWNYQKLGLKITNFYSGKAIKPSTLSSIIHVKLQKTTNKNSARKSFYEKCQNLKNSFSQQSFSTSSISLWFQNQNEQKN